MNDSKYWSEINKLIIDWTRDFSISASEPIKSYSLYDSVSTSSISYVEANPLFAFPIDIRDNICNEYYDLGMSSMAQRYIESNYLISGKNNELQKLFTDIYFYAVKKDKHTLAYNLIVVLSQIPYLYLGGWACILAMSATRNKYMDIVELGIRCFENWESKDACSFLKQCNFSETWLQKYADEVCAYLEEENKDEYVLFEKNYTWKVARGKTDSTGNIEGYTSRYSTSRI